MKLLLKNKILFGLFFLAVCLAQLPLKMSAQTVYYIGDDAVEGTAITPGIGNYSVANLTFAFPEAASGCLYTNTSGSTQYIQLTQVNYLGAGGAGTIQPFVAIYTGDQATGNLQASSYNVIMVGDAISTTADTAVHNIQFLFLGSNPTIALSPGTILCAGFVQSGSPGCVAYGSGTSLSDYIYNGNSLPSSLPGSFKANSTYSLNNTLKFNIGFILVAEHTATSTDISTSSSSTYYGSNVTFTATVTPTPPDGELAVFKDGITTIATAAITNGQAFFSTSLLSAGVHSINVVYQGDAIYLPSSSFSIKQTVRYPFVGTYYIGDDALEQVAVTAGSQSQYGGNASTFAFAQSGTIYTNTTSSVQNIKLFQVNYYAGNAGGTIQPFVALYTGAQNNDDIASGFNYQVLVMGDLITETANTGANSTQFLLNGTNPVVALNPGDVLVAGFYGGVVQVDATATGLNDYIYDGNALPWGDSGDLTIDSTYFLDGTFKFNIGFVVDGMAEPTVMTLDSGANPSFKNSALILTANINPAPTNGESVIFYDGTNILGSSVLNNGQSIFTASSLAVGRHSIKAVYNYDGHYLASSASLLQVVAAQFQGTYYIGDDAFEGRNVTAGTSADTVATLTYGFAQSGSGNYSTYTNTTAFTQALVLKEVNFYSSHSTGGGSNTVIPFVAVYSGSQSATDIGNANNYSVISIGDVIQVDTNFPGLVNQQFLVNGTNPVIMLSPGAVLMSGFEVSGSQLIQYDITGSGAIDYIYNGYSLPNSPVGALTASTTYNLDRTIKFNIGFWLGQIQTTSTITSSQNPSAISSNITFVATVDPAPTNHEVVTFMDGTNILSVSSINNGQANFTTSMLSAGLHSIAVSYYGDNYYLPSISTPVMQIVGAGDSPQLSVSLANGNQFNISWPSSYLGWKLQCQTNPSAIGLSNNWTTISDSSVGTNLTVTIDPNNGSVFFRLISP